MLPSRTPPRCLGRGIPKGFLFFLALLAIISMICFFSRSHKVFAKLFAKFVMPLQQVCHHPQHFFGLLSWVVEDCQNVIPSKICHLITGLAQQEHCFLNICSNIIQINEYLLFWIYVPLSLTATTLTEEPPHRHSSIEFFQMWHVQIFLFSLIFQDITNKTVHTAWKVSKYGIISGPYFPVFEPEITPYLDTSHAVPISLPGPDYLAPESVNICCFRSASFT